MKLSDKFKLIKIFDPKSGLKSQMYASRPSAKDKLTKEQLEVLRTISRNEIDFQRLLHSDLEKINIWIKRYYLRKPVIEDLKSQRIKVKDIDDLIHPEIENETYLKSIPILVKWLKKKDLSYHVKSVITHILSNQTDAKRAAFDTIIEQYKITDCLYRDELNNGYEYCQFMENAFINWLDDSYAGTLFELLSKDKYKLRMLLYLALPKLKAPKNKKRAIKFLTERLEEYLEKNVGFPIVPLEVLGKLKATETKELVKKFLTHPNNEVRREAKKTITLFDKFDKYSTRRVI